MKTAVFYGSSTGNTADVAKRIARTLGVPDTDVYDVAETAPSRLGDYDCLILGSPTYGSGELQDDWYDFIDGAEMLDLKGKTVALFGTGDEGMTDTFCNAVGILRHRLERTGATFTGAFTTEPYDYGHSEAVDDGPDNPARIACGLLLDEVNRPELTDDRIARWAATLKEADSAK